MKPAKNFCQQKGFSLIELLIGIAVGIIAMIVAYLAFEGTEHSRRTVASVGGLQVDGMYALFLTSADVGNAGMSFAANSTALGNCQRDLTTGFFPVPALVNPGNTSILTEFNGANRDPNSDQLYISYAKTSTMVLPVLTTALANGELVQAQAPTSNAFNDGDHVVVSSQTQCSDAIVAGNGTLNAANGVTTFNLDRSLSAAYPAGSNVVNLGNDSNISRVVYWLGTDGVFYRTDLTAPRTDPVLSNVVRFNVQYGVAAAASSSTATMPATTWVDPATSPWDVTTLMALPYNAGLGRIKALRVSFVLRADEPEKELAGSGFSGTIFADNAGLSGSPPAQTIAIPAAPNEAMGWRYRIFETVIPLRNNIWN